MGTKNLISSSGVSRGAFVSFTPPSQTRGACFELCSLPPADAQQNSPALERAIANTSKFTHEIALRQERFHQQRETLSLVSALDRPQLAAEHGGGALCVSARGKTGSARRGGREDVLFILFSLAGCPFHLVIKVPVAQSPENQALVQDAVTKDTSCVFPLRRLDLLSCEQLHRQHGARGTKFPSLTNPRHGGGLCLWKPPFTLRSSSQLCEQRKGGIREGEIPSKAKSVVLYCHHKVDLLLTPDKGHPSLWSYGQLCCWQYLTGTSGARSTSRGQAGQKLSLPGLLLESTAKYLLK